MAANTRLYTVLVIVFLALVTMIGFILGLFVFTQQASEFQKRDSCDVPADVIRDALSDPCTYPVVLSVSFDGKKMTCNSTSTVKHTSEPPNVTLVSGEKV